MEVRAVTRYVRISPRKARLVTELIKGKPVEEALTILRFVPKKAARLVDKTLRSALANAEQNPNIDVDTLYIKRIFVDGGPTMKRWRARAMGRATKILKRSSHITVILDEA
ncbi:MAG: 50S ribosomal protein L22 [Syntrophobacteria bacterium]|jgi:large subunit ribosomal protein L22|nr:50S ribosomal protein L22 [Deltaproteobacteria bacterium]PNV87138.1 MAG: 50S ribosomal protein L22 [Desulfobacteraceae bacterium]MDH3774567.1 50S ribosomal protein L22 [Deltaproteobacteria bacterium]MDH3851913.1 50S ribosomal protein L22 [Deltaproteobacteria bacterium]MDH3896732.1 50S ribosomal protein L22 [Deltaproteobacteria bacterium]